MYIRVVAAIIHKDDKILIARRKQGAHLEFKWEYPGGKVEENEDEKDEKDLVEKEAQDSQQTQTLPERRLAARHATCLARLTEDASRRTKLLHAAALHRHAGSSRAAASLVNEAHALRGA